MMRPNSPAWAGIFSARWNAMIYQLCRRLGTALVMFAPMPACLAWIRRNLLRISNAIAPCRRNTPYFVPKRKINLPRGTVPALSVVAAVVMLGTWYGVQLDTVAAPNPAVMAFDPDQVEDAAPTPDNILTLRTSAPSWISIRDERGRLTVNRVFVTGETWQAEVGQDYTLEVRDGGAVELYIGETPRGPLGAQGVPLRDVDLSIIR
jgi:hypothetical protein